MFKLLQVVLTFVYKLLQVGTRCLCVTICLQVVTSCYNVLQVHVSPRSEVTFGYDVGRRRAPQNPGQKCSYILLTHLLYLFSCSTTVLAENLTLSYSLIIHAKYYVPRPTRCMRYQPKIIHKCSAKNFNPSDFLFEIMMLICQQFETSLFTYFYFFGAKHKTF